MDLKAEPQQHMGGQRLDLISEFGGANIQTYVLNARSGPEIGTKSSMTNLSSGPPYGDQLLALR